ncbi:MAG: alpha/beta hydrolase, partial [Gemmatimonadota bacterium]
VSVMSIAMDCASGVDEERRRRIESETPGSVFGRMVNLLEPESCESVDVADLGPDFRSPLESDVPTLFVSGTLDSNTPPWQAEENRKGFPNSAHIVVENAGHESTLPVPEVQGSIVKFMGGENLEDRRVALPALEFEPIATAVACESASPVGFEPAGDWAFETTVRGRAVTGTIAVQRQGSGFAASIEAEGVPSLEVESASMEGACLVIMALDPDAVPIEFRLWYREPGLEGRWTIKSGASGEIVARPVPMPVPRARTEGR